MSRSALFRLLHLVWALLCLAVIVFLVGATEGHPPGIVFAPFAVAIWALGHLGLRLTHWLLRRGLAGLVGDRASWPLPVVLAIVGSGVMSFLFVVFLGAMALDVDRLTLWNGLVAAALAMHPPVFVGLLLRRGWGRVLAAAVAGFWALLMLYQIVDHLRRGSPVRAWEWPASVSIVLAFSWLCWSLLRGPAVAGYFARRSTPARRDGYTADRLEP